MHGMARPVGRPPMHLKATHIRLPNDMPARITRALGPGEKKADLIREAIERELQRREAESKPKKRPK
jgi:predicted DNA-binding protein